MASASPRRDELLNLMGLPHEILVTDADESPEGGPPDGSGMNYAEWYALSASAAKAKAAEAAVFCPTCGSAASIGGNTLIVAADTVVTPDGEEVYGKPEDAEDAARMLRSLSGREHYVIGGITVSNGVRRVSRCVTTVVRMKDLTDGEISAYIRTGEPFGKAGAYAIQGRAAVLVDSLNGDYGNVVGISTSALRDILKFDFSAEIL